MTPVRAAGSRRPTCGTATRPPRPCCSRMQGNAQERTRQQPLDRSFGIPTSVETAASSCRSVKLSSNSANRLGTSVMGQ